MTAEQIDARIESQRLEAALADLRLLEPHHD